MVKLLKRILLIYINVAHSIDQPTEIILRSDVSKLVSFLTKVRRSWKQNSVRQDRLENRR